MKNNKKSYSQNRIKGYFLKKGKYGKSRIKDSEENLNTQEIDDKAEKDPSLENPEEQGDLS